MTAATNSALDLTGLAAADDKLGAHSITTAALSFD